jgi:hypothetical protein
LTAQTAEAGTSKGFAVLQARITVGLERKQRETLHQAGKPAADVEFAALQRVLEDGREH